MLLEESSYNKLKENLTIFTTCRVIRAHDFLMSVTIKPKNISSTFKFKPGQYIEIMHGNISFSLSIAGQTHEGYLELHILDSDYRPISHHLKNIFQQKQFIVKGPLGNNILTEDDSPLLFIAGGTGITPHYCIINHAIRNQINRKMVLYWGVRHPKYLYLDKKFKTLEMEYSNFLYRSSISRSCSEFQGKTEPIYSKIIRGTRDIGNYNIYISGPKTMLLNVREKLLELGVDVKKIHGDFY